MLLSVDHVTRYRYARPVRGVVQSLRLTPATCDMQRVLAWEVAVDGGQRGGSFRDGAGDLVTAWTVAGPVDEIVVRVAGTVETQGTAGVLRGHREAAPPLAWLRETPATAADAALADLAAGALRPGDALATAHAMAAAVAEAVAWTPGATDAATTAAQALAAGQGVCQDHAHVLIAAARSAGMPARYVAGYMFDAAEAGEAAHAWAELWVERLGWVGFDPANRCCPDARYVRLGAGLDARDAAPIRGIARGGTVAEDLQVAVRVQALQAQRQGQQ
jgi:transglutaminase-like putative cysteine protease